MNEDQVATQRTYFYSESHERRKIAIVLYLNRTDLTILNGSHNIYYVK
jgi:hypothetical protein